MRKKEKRRKTKKEKTMVVKEVAEEWEIWDKKEEAVKSKKEAKKLVSQRFYKWIYVFGKKASEWMLIKKLWDHIIEVKKGFVPKKEKIYLLSRERRGEVHEFIKEQLRKKVH